MNKKIASEVALGVILLLAIVIGGLFWMQNKKEEKTAQTPAKTTAQSSKDSRIVATDYGFKFSVPVGWNIWEGNSAAADLMNKTDFASVLEAGASALTSQKVKEYQTFMDNWKAQSSEVVVFTDSKTLDLKNRSFSDAGKIMSRLVDSEDILKQGEITMHVGTSEVSLSDPSVNDEKKESRNIKINGNDARYSLIKNGNITDSIIIRMPIKSTKTISGKKVSSLAFTEYVKKNNPNSLNELISFISSLNVVDNQ